MTDFLHHRRAARRPAHTEGDMNSGLITHFVTLPAVAPAAARNANHTAAAVDAHNIEGMATLTLVGVAGAAVTVTIQESDDGSTNWTTVDSPAASAAIGRQPPLSIPITASLSVFEVNFSREKRYLRVVLTGSDHNLAGTIKGRAKYLGS